MTFKREKRHDESCRLPKTYYTVLLEHTLRWLRFFVFGRQIKSCVVYHETGDFRKRSLVFCCLQRIGEPHTAGNLRQNSGQRVLAFFDGKVYNKGKPVSKNIGEVEPCF